MLMKCTVDDQLSSSGVPEVSDQIQINRCVRAAAADGARAHRHSVFDPCGPISSLLPFSPYTWKLISASVPAPGMSEVQIHKDQGYSEEIPPSADSVIVVSNGDSAEGTDERSNLHIEDVRQATLKLSSLQKQLVTNALTNS
ncbi:hypothetical protein EYF80_061679 [Liparis tanakae]|uniref:Uncharacterized protein n=1 Tax=Liparis tanakae TaxID=230148 RepID=A0A4Z2EHA0_9TELE|nr:hypothetical protein EYF80_061679 [Liparis tanakae]